MTLGGCPSCGQHPHHSIGCPIATGVMSGSTVIPPAEPFKGRFWTDEALAEHDRQVIRAYAETLQMGRRRDALAYAESLSNVVRPGGE